MQGEQLINVAVLSDAQRIVLADVLLDSVNDDSDPLTQKQKALLSSRLTEARQNPEIYQSWEDAKIQILSQLQ